MRRKSIGMVSLAAVVILLLMFSFSTEVYSSSEEPIKIGHVVPFTGDLSFIGQPFQNAAMLAVEEINAAGGVLGREVVIISEDSATDARGAVDALDKLINIDRVEVVAGGISSMEASASIEKIRLNEILMISPSATSATLTDANDDDFFFRTCPSDALQGATLAMLAREKGYETASLLSRTDDYGLGLEDIFVKTFEELGGEVIRKVRYDPKTPDFSGYITQVTERPADVIVVNALMEDGVRIFNRKQRMGVIEDFEFLVSEGVQDQGIPQEVGFEAMAGIGGSTPYPVETGDFPQKYKDKYGEDPVAYCANVYDNFILLALAIQHAGKYEGPAVRDSLREVANPPGEVVNDVTRALELVREGKDISYQGAGGEIIFDENGDIRAERARTWIYNEEGQIEITGEIEVDAGN